MNCIVAVCSDWGIGSGGTQQIVLPEDRLRFKNLTNGGTVIVGRKTFEDFPGAKPLSGRKNIVITHNKKYNAGEAVVVTSPGELFFAINAIEHDKLFVIGGGSVYDMLLPYCKFAYVTKLHAAPPADTFFQNLDKTPGWELIKSEGVQESSGIFYSFNVYENKSPLCYPRSDDL